MAIHATRFCAPAGRPMVAALPAGGSTPRKSPPGPGITPLSQFPSATAGRGLPARRTLEVPRVSGSERHVQTSEHIAEKPVDDRTRVRAFLERLFHSEEQVCTADCATATEWSRLALCSHPPVGSPEPSCDTLQVKLEERPSSSSSEPNGGKGDKEPEEHGSKGNDYYANVGYAIRTLRDDIPLLFMKDLNYDIYRDDIVFKDPRNTFSGMKNYKLIFWSLRFHGRIFFRVVFVEIKRLWQIDDNCIRMRWTVHGFPRVPWEAEGTFDGVSEFKLDKDGKIYSHSVDNVIFRDPPGERLPLFALPNLTPAGNQQPVPGGWCFNDDSQKLLPRFSWIRLYLAAALLPSLMSPKPDASP